MSYAVPHPAARSRLACVVLGFLLLFGVTAGAAAKSDKDAVIGPVALKTADGRLRLHIIEHASFVATWNGHTLYVDPVGDPARYAGLPAPDVILITHAHHDHFAPDTLAALETRHAVVVMPETVNEKMKETVGAQHIVLENGDKTTVHDIPIRAIPAYNLPASPDAHHPKGWGNGYVLTLADKRVYISGDTEGVPAMRHLDNIDLAFVCMNLPYTMDTEQAADVVLDFKPKVVYPYHYRGQNIEDFKRRVNAGDSDIDVRLRDWYPDDGG